jgi:hypothetical protein
MRRRQGARRPGANVAAPAACTGRTGLPLRKPVCSSPSTSGRDLAPNEPISTERETNYSGSLRRRTGTTRNIGRSSRSKPDSPGSGGSPRSTQAHDRRPEHFTRPGPDTVRTRTLRLHRSRRLTTSAPRSTVGNSSGFWNTYGQRWPSSWLPNTSLTRCGAPTPRLGRSWRSAGTLTRRFSPSEAERSMTCSLRMASLDRSESPVRERGARRRRAETATWLGTAQGTSRLPGLDSRQPRQRFSLARDREGVQGDHRIERRARRSDRSTRARLGSRGRQ